jgi:alpha-methylacyl-CoA racemase
MTITGPLGGLKVVELGGIGPTPFAGMVLADLGADVIQIMRPGRRSFPEDERFAVLNRGRTSVEVDLKAGSGREFALQLVSRADVFLEGYRPGVVERLGLGPGDCFARNRKLVYGRMTGWGQDGPMASVAGHDINYVAITGMLGAIGRHGGPPQVPLNLLADYGGGGMLMIVGVLAALHESRTSGLGQVVDSAMIDGVALLGAMIYGAYAGGEWIDERGANRLDTGRPYYDVYETLDGRYVAVGALEDQFFEELLERLGMTAGEFDRLDPRSWPDLRERLAAVFKTRTQLEWTALLGDRDTCVSPVLSIDEARHHPQLAARYTLVEVDGVLQPSPAPRFSRTPGGLRPKSDAPAEQVASLLRRWGLDGLAVPTEETARTTGT